MKRLGRLERHLFFWCVSVGATLTLVTLLLDFAGFLGPIERWVYDHRARWCQVFSKPPTDQIVHLDIDDKAIDAIGKWPWPRTKLAKMLDEMAIAKPKVVGFDVVFSDPTSNIELPDGKIIPLDDDRQLADAMRRLGNVVSSVSLNPRPPQVVTSVEAASLAELIENLELSQQQLGERLARRAFPKDQIESALADDAYLGARKRAAVERITRELKSSPLTYTELLRKVLPTTDLTIKSPLLRLVSEQYNRGIALRAIERFSMTPPASITAPLPTDPTLVPLAEISNASAGLGFVDADTTESVVRTLPLYVELDRRVYPQFGFAFGCRMIGVDPTKALLSNSEVKLLTPKGLSLIPVHQFESRRFGRDLSLFADVPWFGPAEWQAMYGPIERGVVQRHLSLGFLWDIVQLDERLRRNNEAVDAAIETVLREPEGDIIRFGLDGARYSRYVAKMLGPLDAKSRRPSIDETLTILHESPLYDFFRDPKNVLNDAEKQQKGILGSAERALQNALTQNEQLQDQLVLQRAYLAKQIAAKGVLIGWTATGASDLVTTSLHARCPGVLVHGMIANAVITGEWWKTTPSWISVLVTIFVGFGGSVVVGLYRPIVATIGAVLMIILFCLINGYLVFDYGNYIMDAAAPLTAIGLVWAGATTTRAVIEGIERVRAEFAKINLEKEKLQLENEKMVAEKDLQTFRHEMELAKTVQVALIPKESPTMEGIDNFGWNKPADMTGGDCFDLWKLPDGRLGILLADASGHGLAPAMIVSQVRTLVRALAETETHPDTILNRVNARLAADLEASRFVTCFLGFINGVGECHWASAGHGPMLWNEREGEPMKELESTALPLGIDGDWMGDIVPPLQLQESGMLLVMSDGIFEAPDPVKDQFGVERVLDVLKQHPGASAVEITAAIRDAVTAWQQKDSPADDQTTVIIRRVAAGVSVTVVEDKSASNPPPAIEQ